MMGKRLFDITISSTALLLLSPFFILMSMIIKYTSPGPALTKIKKVGKNGRGFDLYHFRTTRLASSLHTNNDLNQEPPFSPMFTPFGKQLVELKLNKLPELFNILKGEMSLVGPQPESPDYVQTFMTDFETILQVKPGMFGFRPNSFFEHPPPSTAIAQQEQPYMPSPLPQNIKFAKKYVQGHSFFLDLKILFTHLSTSFFFISLPARNRGTAEYKTIKDHIFDARGKIIFSMHLTAIFFCHYAAFWLRFDGTIPESAITAFMKSTPLVLIIQMSFLYFFGVSRGLWRYAGLRDFLNIGFTVASSTIVSWALLSVFSLENYPRSIYLINAMLLLLVLSALRASKRIYTILTQTDVGANRVLIIGAGNAGELIVRDMKQDRRHRCRPVGFIDDDPKKREKLIHNIPVLGNSNEIEQVVAKIFPDEVLIAIPSGSPEEIKRIIQHCKSLKLPIKTLPNLSAILEGKATLTDIRPLDIEDLLGRAEIKIHDPQVASKIKGKRILVTGAGGSIGSELCRQLASFEPEQLILVERHENNLYQIELDLRRQFPALSLNPFMADILDSEKMNKIFSKTTPHMVFHAAAYKHVPMMERNPLEAIRNNIMGTYRLLIAADKFGTSEFVLISTDKAVSPSSIMGATKRVAEMMVRYFDTKSQTRLISVRFGNVLESAGSVVPIFRAQIKNGGPVQVTHPEVKRYFISIQEAVQLVLQASLLGKGGEVFVLDMGKEVKVIDLAKTMIILSGFSPGVEIPIKIIGLRPGEKLSEGLFEEGEHVLQTRHKKIRLAKNNNERLCDLPQFIKRFEAMDNQTDMAEIQSVLKELIPTYQAGKLAKAVLTTETAEQPGSAEKIAAPVLKP